MTTWRKDPAVHDVITGWRGASSSPLDAMDTAVAAYKRWLASEIHHNALWLDEVLALLAREDKP